MICFHQLVELFLLGGGSGKSNRKFVHAVHYPAKRAGDNRISGVAFETVGHTTVVRLVTH